MINPGKYRHRIKIQQQEKDEDGNVRPEADWEDVATVWSDMITTGGGKFYAAQKICAETNALFEMRYRAGIDATMRIMFGSREFSILYVNNVNGINEELQLICREVI